jgi:hypothetical protein
MTSKGWHALSRTTFAGLAVALTACVGMDDVPEDTTTAVEAISEPGCATVGADVSVTGGFATTATSPQTYGTSSCTKARVIDINSYASTYAIGGSTKIAWADAVPTGSSACLALYLRADLYSRSGSTWTYVKTKTSRGDYLLDQLPGDVVLPPAQPGAPPPPPPPDDGPITPPPPGTFPPVVTLPVTCRGPAVYFYGADMDAGKNYRIVISARTTSSISAATRKHSILSRAGTCGQNALVCCNSSVCASGLSCQSGTCRTCGALNEACCTGSTCDNTGLTCQSGVCKNCGGLNEGCCAGSTCDNTGLTCQSGVCKNCGGLNERCCAGSVCDTGSLTCNSSQTCVSAAPPCGTTGGACCAAPNRCTVDGNSCIGNICQSTIGLCNDVGELCCEPMGTGATQRWCNQMTTKVPDLVCDQASRKCVSPSGNY